MMVELPLVVLTPEVSEREVSTTAASGLVTEELLTPKPRTSLGQLSVDNGSETVAVTVEPASAVVPAAFDTGSTVRFASPAIDAELVPPAVGVTVIGLDGSSARQSPYQTVYEEVNG
jgi:hypothetical protein